MDLNSDENEYLILFYTTSNSGAFKCFFSLTKLTRKKKRN